MRFYIKGGKRLSGEIKLAGAKNAATKMMVASLLTNELVVLNNVPNIGDVHITSELCRMIGSQITMSGSELKIITPSIKNAKVSSLSRRNRIPILTLGPLLHRSGYAEVPYLGGDKIGPRPVNFHLDGLRAMGAEIKTGANKFIAAAPKGLYGAKIVLPYPSVGATENIILAATLAKGTTVICNAAREPEVMDLISMLTAMGADIRVGGQRTITVNGVPRLSGVSHTVMYDRNEAVSFASLALATNGDIHVVGANKEHLISFLNCFTKIGGGYEITEHGIRFFKKSDFRPLDLETDVYPGFMTDWQQPFAVLLTQAKGVSTIHETVYEDRFAYVEDLNKMGARIKIESQCCSRSSLHGGPICRFYQKQYLHCAVINGGTPLVAAKIKVRDLRAGMAHVIAGLIAKGETVLDNVEELDRGYERLEERLQELGADIRREL